MTEELIAGKDLIDHFTFLTNNKIPKFRDASEVPEIYLEMFNTMEKTFLNLKEVKENDVITGVITSITDKEIMIEFGYKDYIYVDKPKKSNVSTDLSIGDTIDVLVTKISDNPYIIRGSITELIKQNVHSKMKNYYENNIPLTSSVKSMIPAGYMMDIHMDNVTIEAFMPNTLADVNKLSNSQSILGEIFEVMLETLQQEKGVYVVSRRKYLQSLIPQEIKNGLIKEWSEATSKFPTELIIQPINYENIKKNIKIIENNNTNIIRFKNMLYSIREIVKQTTLKQADHKTFDRLQKFKQNIIQEFNVIKPLIHSDWKIDERFQNLKKELINTKGKIFGDNINKALYDFEQAIRAYRDS